MVCVRRERKFLKVYFEEGLKSISQTKIYQNNKLLRKDNSTVLEINLLLFIGKNWRREIKL